VISFIASRMPPRIACCFCVKWLMRVTITSESVVDRKRMPTPLSRSRSSTVLTRLPLCASAIVLGPIELSIGWAFSQFVEEPVVE